MGPRDDGDETETWRRLDRSPVREVPGVVAGDISEWLGTLDESAVTQVLEVYLPTEPEDFSLADVAASTGIEIGQLRLFWQAFGFPHLPDDSMQLTAQDVELMSTFTAFFVDQAREQGVGLQMARVLGSNLDRIASAQVDSLVARVLLNGAAVDVAAERSQAFSELMPRLLELVWRRHLANATRRRLLRPTVGDTATLCVGFADMVGFTATAQKLNQLELARVVGFFEAEAYEVVTSGGGRVVKTIGDEVMFVAEDVGSGAAIAVDLAQRFRDDPMLPPVHVGLAAGPVIQRRGDVYGPTVNLAARIVSVALPGSVLVSEEVHDLLADDPDFDFRAAFEYQLADIGTVTLWRVRRPGTPGVASQVLLDSDDSWRQSFAGRWSRYPEAIGERVRVQLRSSAVPFPERVRRLLEGEAGAVDINQLAMDLSAEEIATVEASILAADLEPELQVELLGDLYATQELRALTRDAEHRVAETDDVAVRRLREVEDETVRRISQAEAEAREKVAAAMQHARDETRDVDVAAQELVQELIERAREEEERVRADARVRAAREVDRSRRTR
jgi:adenylate cyclase